MSIRIQLSESSAQTPIHAVSRLSAKRRFLASSLASVIAVGCATNEGSANAGQLCDWLFGRTSPTYAAGYPYAAGYVPITTTNAPYTAGYAPYGPTYAVGSSYSAGYAGTASAVQMPAYGVTQVGSLSSVGVYNNPSVYTGQPVLAGQPYGAVPLATALRPALNSNPFSSFSPSASVPLTSTLRGNETPSGSFYGVGNAYPNTYGTPNYQANYAPVVGVSGGPATTLPSTSTVPLFPNAPAPQQGGLARFFGSLFGTNYNSSYYRAPITYYRPVTSIDPVTGTTVTVQQPCDSYVQQLQRTPYSSLFAQSPMPAYAPSTIAPSCSSPTCNAPGYNVSPYGQSLVPLQGGSYGPSNVAPVSGYGASNDSSVVPIPTIQSPGYGYGASSGYDATPSYAPTPSYEAVPNYAPAPSYSPSVSPLTGGNGDQSSVQQPRLESARPSTTDDSYDAERDLYYRSRVSPSFEAPSLEAPSLDAPSLSAPSLEAPQQNELSWQRESTYQVESPQSAQAQDDFTKTNHATSLRPIPAPDSYRAQDTRNWSLDTPSPVLTERPSTSAVRQPDTDWNTSTQTSTNRTFTLEAPPLPPATIPPSNDYRNELPNFPSATFLPPSTRPTSKQSAPVRTLAREASLPQQSQRVEAARVPADFVPLQKPVTETGWRAIP